MREKAVKECNGKVSFCGHIGSRQELVARNYDADVFVFPPIWDEGFGIPPIEVAEKTLLLLRDDDLREEMGRTARRWALATFTWDWVADRLRDEYCRLCGIQAQPGDAELDLLGEVRSQRSPLDAVSGLPPSKALNAWLV